jgi:hypothetical protein
MACDSKTYSGLSAATMEAIRLDLSKMGMNMPNTPEGTVAVSEFGVEVQFRFSEQAATLWVQVSQKPFFVPCAMIYARLDQAVARHQSGADPATPH